MQEGTDSADGPRRFSGAAAASSGGGGELAVAAAAAPRVVRRVIGQQVRCPYGVQNLVE